MTELNSHILADVVEASNDLQQATSAVTPKETAKVDGSGFVEMGLAPELLAALRDLSFTQPTTVQVRAIPLALQDNADKPANDLLVSSQTGSGKTAAFLLPVLHTLLQQQQQQEKDENKAWADKVAQAAARGEEAPKKQRRKNPTDTRHVKPANPGALILCPTRELAQQVAKDAIDLVRHCKGLRIACVVGGMPYPLQIARLHNADLVVATPGRLLDLQSSKQLHLDKVQFLVVDEADRMLDLGFAEDLAEVHKLTQTRRQTMMFSATFAPRIQQLAARIMRAPQRLQVDSPQEAHANIKQVLFWADSQQHKRKLLDIGCATPPSTKPLFLLQPKLNAMLWPKISSKWVSLQLLCMVRSAKACAIAVCKRCAMDVSKFWWPPMWLRAASMCPVSAMSLISACL